MATKSGEPPSAGNRLRASHSSWRERNDELGRVACCRAALLATCRRWNWMVVALAMTRTASLVTSSGAWPGRRMPSPSAVYPSSASTDASPTHWPSSISPARRWYESGSAVRCSSQMAVGGGWGTRVASFDSGGTASRRTSCTWNSPVAALRNCHSRVEGAHGGRLIVPQVVRCRHAKAVGELGRAAAAAVGVAGLLSTNRSQQCSHQAHVEAGSDGYLHARLLIRPAALARSEARSKQTLYVVPACRPLHAGDGLVHERVRRARVGLAWPRRSLCASAPRRCR